MPLPSRSSLLAARSLRSGTFRANAGGRIRSSPARPLHDYAVRAAPVALAGPCADDLRSALPASGQIPIPARVPSAVLPALAFLRVALPVAGRALRSASPAPRF